MSRIAGQIRGGDEQKQPINCPKCGSPMGKVTFASVVVDRCTSCRGLWFDAREHERLKDMKGSEMLGTCESIPTAADGVRIGAGLDGIASVMDRNVPTVEESTPLDVLKEIILQTGYAVVIDSKRKPIDLISKIDLVEWIYSNQK